MSVIDYDEAVAFNEAVADMHEACDFAREIRDAYECGELELSDAEGWELAAMVREKVEACERWETVLRFPKITVPDPVRDEPSPAQRSPAIAYGRIGRFGIASHGAPPNATFGNTLSRPGDWHGR
jgi:hypothetical protein